MNQRSENEGRIWLLKKIVISMGWESLYDIDNLSDEDMNEILIRLEKSIEK